MDVLAIAIESVRRRQMHEGNDFPEADQVMKSLNDLRSGLKADVELFDSLIDVDWEQMRLEDANSLRFRCQAFAGKLSALLPPDERTG
jgi:hypothetical protein